MSGSKSLRLAPLFDILGFMEMCIYIGKEQNFDAKETQGKA